MNSQDEPVESSQAFHGADLPEALGHRHELGVHDAHDTDEQRQDDDPTLLGIAGHIGVLGVQVIPGTDEVLAQPGFSAGQHTVGDIVAHIDEAQERHRQHEAQGGDQGPEKPYPDALIGDFHRLAERQNHQSVLADRVFGGIGKDAHLHSVQMPRGPAELNGRRCAVYECDNTTVEASKQERFSMNGCWSRPHFSG
jgi:hypothetical protein